jgi:O-antigen chain-terminating methyltransferase
MQNRSVSEDDLRRLKDEREAADRRYNEALSELDAAVQALPPFPDPPPAPDETQITPLNRSWDILAARPASPSGWRGRLAGLLWRLVEPSLARQQSFNAALVDHVNRNVMPQREIPKSIETTIAVLREQVEQLVRFESRMIVFLQQITPYVDTKDYELRGLGQRIVEDVAEAHADTARILRGLAGTVGAVSDDMLKRWERYEGLRTSVATLHQSLHAIGREIESRPAAAMASAGAAYVAGPAANAAPESGVSYALSGSRLQSHKYLSFEDAFRGDPELIGTRQREYLPLFRGRSDVLDIGCGRGEFLQLLNDAGITARGIDINNAMVAHCLEKGLDAREGDALEHLRALPADALGGLLAAQVVEHLQPDYLLALLQESFRVLRPGSPVVLETINVASWSAFFSSYVRDITHARPIHPETLRFFVLATGFLDPEIRFSSSLPEEEKLRTSPREVRDVDLRTTGAEGRAILQLADAFDANAAHLNRQLYGPHDYAVIAWKR